MIKEQADLLTESESSLRSNGVGGKTRASEVKAFLQNIIDTIFGKFYTKADADNLLSGKADVNHTHDDLASKVYTDAAVASIVDSSPATLNTLNELAQALGEDPNFATTISNQIGTKADKTSPNRPGVTRLYRRDEDSNYSVQTHWTGNLWHLRGYQGDTYHAPVYVDIAETAYQLSGVQKNAGSLKIIGTAGDNTNSSYLEFSLASGNSLGYLGDGSSGNNDIQLYANNNLSLWAGGNGGSRIFIKSDGNVGIGNSNPTTKLQVKGTSQVIGIHDNWSGIVLDTENQDEPKVGFRVSDNSERFKIKFLDVNGTNERLGFIKGLGGAQEVFSVLKNGNIGVGANAPAAKLDIQGGSNDNGTGGIPILAIQHSSGGFRHWIKSRHLSAAGSSNNSIDFYLNNSATADASSSPTIGTAHGLSITGKGIGIGTINPTNKLEIAGAGNATVRVRDASGNTPTNIGGTIQLFGTRSDGSIGYYAQLRGNRSDVANHNKGHFAIDVSSTDGSDLAEAFRIIEGGNVGIGTPDPGHKLDVSGTIRSSKKQVITGVTFGDGLFADDASGSNIFSIRRGAWWEGDGNNNQIVYQNYGDFVVTTGGNSGTERLRAHSNGATVTGNFNATVHVDVGGDFSFGSNSGWGINAFLRGNGDNATRGSYNFALKGWYGMAFKTYNDVVTGVFNFRTGSLDLDGEIKIGGSFKTLDNTMSGLQNQSNSSWIRPQDSYGNMHLNVSDASKGMYFDTNNIFFRPANGSTHSMTLNAGGDLSIAGYLAVNSGSVHLGKLGNWSRINFAAQANDPGYIGHYEDNNTAVMQFSVSDDAAGNDYFEWGATPSGAWHQSMKLTGNGHLTVANSMAISNSFSLSPGTLGSMKLTTSSGYVDIGPMNSVFCHFQTDRPSFYMNKMLHIDSGTINAYGTDALYLQVQGYNKATLDANGNFTATGDLTAYSDSRLKTNIRPLENALGKVMALKGVSYTRTDQDEARTQIGFIAQQVKDVLPEVVHYNETNDVHSLDYGKMVAVLVESIKTQQELLDNQQNQIKDLVAELKFVRERLNS